MKTTNAQINKAGELDLIGVIESNKEIMKIINRDLKYYSASQFLADARKYIECIENNSMLCIIKSVSASGMSRVLKYNAYTNGYYRQFDCLFIALGHKENRSRSGFTVNGCGMDMNFHTNYAIIHTFKRLGIITGTECEKLAQKTPIVL